MALSVMMSVVLAIVSLYAHLAIALSRLFAILLPCLLAQRKCLLSVVLPQLHTFTVLFVQGDRNWVVAGTA
jgi:hypothetical protein